MKRFIKILGVVIVVATLSIFGYGAKGYLDVIKRGEELRARADALIAAGRGPDSLGEERLRVLLLVQDPGFHRHSGIDLATPGAGLTTLAQSVAKRLAFDHFRPGIGKIRQTGFALGLSRELSKDQLIALFLRTAEMGNSAQGWVTGFHKASEVFFNKPVGKLADEEFYALVAVLIAPGKLRLSMPDNALKTRVRRIARLARGVCKPLSLTDVWLRGCE
ncbi:MAG TPA: glycosyl transferase [Thermopetrobacter sp.]|nr:glycosyl transferase [Thermopetrobacter sp.]